MRRADRHILKSRIPWRFLTCWIVSIVGGFFWINSYAFTPGLKGASIERYPTNSTLELNKEQPTLCVFLHPKCSCSRATLSELARLTANRVGFEVQFLFFLPADESESWAKTGLWETASQLSTNPPILDRGGDCSAKFKITTSGHVMLFSPEGNVTFSGGVTDGRGHEGDNPSSSILKRILDGEAVPLQELPVFGCPINSIERIESAN